MDLGDIARARVRRHHLDGIGRPSAATAVSDMLALQAQDYRGGLWSVGVRSGLAEADVERALADRQIVRTWPMRGTLHLVAAADARWLPELLGPRASRAAAGRRRDLGLDDHAVTATREAWEQGLAGGNCLGRPELFALMEAAGVNSGNQRGFHLLRHLAEQGVLCFGPHQGNQPTYALLDEWVPDARVLTRDEALAELVLRYFSSHGPATLEDLVGWTMLTKTDARTGLAAVADRLESADVEGATYWFADLDTRPTGAQALPGFDEYVLGYKNRSAFATPEILSAVVPGGNGMFKASVLHDGRIVGLWSVKKRARRHEVRVTWFDGRPLPPPGVVEAAIERYGRFTGVDTEVMPAAG